MVLKTTYSPRSYALIAGLGIIIMAIAAGYSIGFVQSFVLVQHDGLQTLNNLQTNRTLFIGGIAGWIIIFICDIIVAWALYHFFKQEDQKISIYTAVLRVLYAILLGFSIAKLAQIISILSGSGEEMEKANAILTNFAYSEHFWSVGLILFGFHLLGLGILSLKRKTIHKIFGILLIIAAVGYVIVHTGRQISSIDQAMIDSIEKIMSVPMAAGELALAIWLLIAGGKVRN